MQTTNVSQIVLKMLLCYQDISICVCPCAQSICEYANGLIYMNIAHNITLNPFTLRAAKRGLTIFEIFQSQKQFLENI